MSRSKAGRPSQAAVQLGAGSFVDPATGLSQVRLPDDAIDSVTVLPNPYAVEFGRFSSGLVLIQTRRAGDQWRTRLNNLDPTFRTVRGSAFDITGIASFSPRVETGGPLIKDKLFLQQAAQYRYRTSDVPSRPPDELRRSQSFSSFTRADANLSSKHTLTAVAGFFPNFTEFANLGTFTPPDATVDLHGGGQHRGGDRTHPVERFALLGDDRRGQPIPDRGQPAGRPADGAAAGEHPRQFLQPPDPIDHDLSGRRDGLGFESSRQRAASLQGRHRHPARASHRGERELAGADPPIGRHAGAPARFQRRRPRSRSTAPTWRCLPRTGCSRPIAGTWNSARASIATG